MGIQAGKLRSRVVIQRPPADDPRDRMGQPVGDWVDVAEVSANVSPVDSTETFQGQQVRSVGTHLVTIRYRLGIAHGMRFKYRDHKIGRDRIFVIDGEPIAPEEIRGHLECVCQEIK